MKITIKDIVSDILFEEKKEEEKKEEEKKEKKPRSKAKAGIEASTGSGRFSAGVKEAGALAKDDPKKLMQNLKVSSVSGSDDMAKIKDLLKQAFVGTDAMKKVYTGLTQITMGMKTGLKVSVSEIKSRDGIKYLYHTMVGAENAGVLKLDSLVQIENSSGSIIIYQGNKNSWNS
jgi:hypothetical protein